MRTIIATGVVLFTAPGFGSLGWAADAQIDKLRMAATELHAVSYHPGNSRTAAGLPVLASVARPVPVVVPIPSATPVHHEATGHAERSDMTMAALAALAMVGTILFKGRRT